MSSHRKPRLSSARKRARTVTLCAATLSAAALPVAAQAASSSTSSAVKPAAQPPKTAQHPAAKPKTAPKATAKKTVQTASADSSSSSTTSSASGGTSYTVVSGDTLSAIAERALGDGDDYRKLFKLNKDRAEPDGRKFTDASLIDVGWTIELPSGSKSAVVSSTASTADGSSSASGSGSTNETASSSTSTASTASDSSSSSTSSSSSDSSSSSSSSDSDSSTSSTSSSSSSSSYSDDLNGWIDEAISILSENGWDSNAADGDPSEGLMQTTITTFDAYALTGYDDIWNPVDNIIAAAIYAQEAYGGLDVVVADRCGGSCWSGY